MKDEYIPPVDRSQRELVSGLPVTPDHKEINPKTGMQKDYIVLTAAERYKGFVRPVRYKYKHKSCGGITVMANSIAETLARDPGFYKGGFCFFCKRHFLNVEFEWLDGTPVGE